MKKLLFSFFALCLLALPAFAQFADQRTFVGVSTGTANAQAIAIPNYALNIGVVLRFVPSFTNTGAMTLNANAQGAVSVLKSSPTGLVALSGGEIQSGVLAQVVFDGAQYELLPPVSNWCGTSAGSANTQTCNGGSYFNAQTGQTTYFRAGYSNTGAMTFNGYPVYRDTFTGPVALAGGEVVAGNVVGITYDASIPAFHLLSYPLPPVLGTQTSLASAATTDLGSISSHNVLVTGTTTITAFGSSATTTSPIYFVGFSGALTLTYNATSLIIPGSQNRSVRAGDSAILQYLGSGNWKVISYTPISYAGLQSPQVTVYTSGSGTYTVPTGALYLDVKMCGGGGGGGGSGGAGVAVGAAGGNTTFGSAFLTASGAAATSAVGSSTYPTAATATGGDVNVPGGIAWGSGILNTAVFGAGYVAMGVSSPLGAGGAGGVSSSGGTGLTAAGNASGFCAGGGGGGVNANAAYYGGWGGNSGGYLQKIVTSPAATYAYAVGAAGNGGAAGTSGSAGGNGSGGVIYIIAHFQ